MPPQLPDDLVGKWSIHRLPKPAWAARGSGLPFDQSFYFGSYRSAADASGDYILLDGFNGASRNPYHTFDILELRLGGQTILQGYHNQVLTSADGMVEPAVAMDAALLHSDVVGPTATAVGEVPKAAFCNWRRTLCQRTGRYALVVDDLTFRTDSQNMKVSTTWQVTRRRLGSEGAGRPHAGRRSGRRRGFRVAFLRRQETSRARSGDHELERRGQAGRASHRLLSDRARRAAKSPSTLACIRLADNAAALALPQPALARRRGVRADEGRTGGAGRGSSVRARADQRGNRPVLVSSDAPVDLDWDFASGVANVVAAQPTTLRLSLRTPDELRLDGEPAKGTLAGGTVQPAVARGTPRAHRRVAGRRSRRGDSRPHLQRLLAEGRKLRAEALAAAGPAAKPTAAGVAGRVHQPGRRQGGGR